MTILRKLLNQKGAMFGMDARVALIIASVLAATGGVTVMSKIERNRVEAAERGVSILRDGVISYYETIDLDAMPPAIADLFSNSVIEEGILADDPWGNAWEYNVVSDTTKSIEDVPVTIFYVVIHSTGKDATDNSVGISSIAEYVAWAAGGDDIGIKFNTLEIEKKRVKAYVTMGKTVVNALNVYESSKYLEAEALCAPGGTNPADADCTNSGKVYSEYNYYPESNPQGNGGGGTAVYYNNVTGAATSFTSGNAGDMQALMTEIALPTAYAIDPWGRPLNYESNATGRNEAPFSASVWYQ
jgi:hypothetical protein